jgi:hypothetical protein
MKNKACDISHGEEYWLVKTSMRSRIFTKMSAPRCDKIGHALIGYVLSGVTTNKKE